MNVRSTRRARHHEADRSDLLTAAEQAFSHRGYAGTSMRDIAAEAGLSVGGVYQFFSGKDDLYVAVVERLFGEYRAALEPALAERTFDRRLQAVTATSLAFFGARRPFLSLLLAERGSFTPAFHDRLSRVVERFKRRRRRQIVALMQQGVAEGRVRFSDAEFLTSAYLGLVSQCNLDAISRPRRQLPAPDDLVSLFCTGVARQPD
jgi:AcrR family transcriptional regulator